MDKGDEAVNSVDSDSTDTSISLMLDNKAVTLIAAA